MGAAPEAEPRAEVTPWGAQSDTSSSVLPLGAPRVMPPGLVLPLEGPVSAEGLPVDDEEPGVTSLMCLIVPLLSCPVLPRTVPSPRGVSGTLHPLIWE